MSEDPPSVVVTGASTGIGAATSRVLTAAGLRVFGGVRREMDGDRLARELGSRFVPLRFDVTDATAVRAAAADVERAMAGRRLLGLVNNAGIAVLGPLLELDPADLRHQLEVNLIGQLVVTQAFAALLGAHPDRGGPPGRIVMMSSLAGRRASPFMGPYSASKFALEGLSECLRRELMLFGIGVIVIAPGAIATPIWDKAEALDISPLAASPYLPALMRARRVIAYGRSGLPPDRIGRLVLHALTTARPKLRYTITPGPLGHWILGRLPTRLVDRLIAKRLGLAPR